MLLLSVNIMTSYTMTANKSTQPVSRFHGGSHTLVPYVMEDGGRTGNQGLALLRLLAERAVASGHVVAPLLWGPVTPASLVALTVHSVLFETQKSHTA